MIRTLLVLSLLITPTLAQAELPQVSDARIAVPPPGAPVAAGYFTLVNLDESALVITGAQSEAADKIEVHLTTIVDEVARMTRQEELKVEPGATLTLEHGGYHLMFMGLSAPFEAGDEIAITLETSAGPLDIVLPVGDVSTGMEHSTMKHDDMKHDTMNHEAKQHD